MTALSIPDSFRDEQTQRLLRRIRGEFHGMPGPRLTAEEAARLWWLDAGVGDELMTRLVAASCLSRSANGTYRRSVER